MTKGIHRVTANSRRGRQMIHTGLESKPWTLTQEQREWNARVDAKKAKKANRELTNLKEKT